LKVFIDNNLPPRLARALHILVEPEGHEVAHLRDRFPEDAADTEWITKLGAEGDWVVITSDLDVSRSHIEKAVWRRYGLVAFLLTKGFNSFSPLEVSWRLIKLWPKIEQQVSLASPGSIYKLTPNSGGKIGTV
jgi:PIN like domain